MSDGLELECVRHTIEGYGYFLIFLNFIIRLCVLVALTKFKGYIIYRNNKKSEREICMLMIVS